MATSDSATRASLLSMRVFIAPPSDAGVETKAIRPESVPRAAAALEGMKGAQRWRFTQDGRDRSAGLPMPGRHWRPRAARRRAGGSLNRIVAIRAARWADHENVVRPRRRDFERAFGVGLPLYFREVHVVSRPLLEQPGDVHFRARQLGPARPGSRRARPGSRPPGPAAPAPRPPRQGSLRRVEQLYGQCRLWPAIHSGHACTAGE